MPLFFLIGMPSGGGGAGAGGGGGGFGGGGISFGGYDGGKLKAVLCFVVNLVIVILVIGSLIGGVLSSRSNSTDISTSFYSPGDSRLLFLSSFFCDGGSLELSSNSVNAELLLVDSTPPLDNTNNFTITVDSSFDSLEFQFWQYHLHPNSNITLSIQTLRTHPLLSSPHLPYRGRRLSNVPRPHTYLREPP